MAEDSNSEVSKNVYGNLDSQQKGRSATTAPRPLSAVESARRLPPFIMVEVGPEDSNLSPRTVVGNAPIAEAEHAEAMPQANEADPYSNLMSWVGQVRPGTPEYLAVQRSAEILGHDAVFADPHNPSETRDIAHQKAKVLRAQHEQQMGDPAYRNAATRLEALIARGTPAWSAAETTARIYVEDSHAVGAFVTATLARLITRSLRNPFHRSVEEPAHIQKVREQNISEINPFDDIRSWLSHIRPDSPEFRALEIQAERTKLESLLDPDDTERDRTTRDRLAELEGRVERDFRGNAVIRGTYLKAEAALAELVAEGSPLWNHFLSRSSFPDNTPSDTTSLVKDKIGQLLRVNANKIKMGNALLFPKV